MPKAMQHLRDHMLSLHPDWDYKLWTLQNIPPIKNLATYEFLKRDMFKSDVIRYEILYEHGGVYADTDFLFYRNIEPLLHDTDHLLIGQLDKGKLGWINNALMAFEPRHAFIKALIDGMPEMLRKGIKQVDKVGEMTTGLHVAGPIYLTKKSNALLANRLVAHKSLFCGMRYNHAKKGVLEDYPNAYALHLWASSFGKNGLDETLILRAIKNAPPHR